MNDPQMKGQAVPAMQVLVGLPPEMAEEVRKIARETGQTLGQTIEQMTRDYLKRRQHEPTSK